jgi:mRNA interferase YafQ
MRTIERTNQFKRDFKRLSKGPDANSLRPKLAEAVNMLAHDLPLPVSLRDHALTGNWKDHRDCHIRPDLVLIYSKPAEDQLILARLGSHSELGL